MLLDKIPGYKTAMAAAAAREQEIRDLAFLPVPLQICGVEVAQLNLRHLLMLFACESPFFSRRLARPEHVVQFLWVVSPKFSFDAAERTAFVRRVGVHVDYAESVIAIERYLDEALMDRPAVAAASKSHAAITSFVAGFIDEIASHYGWDDDVILGKPIARLYQYLRQIRQRENPKSVFFNRFSDRTRKELVKEFMAQQATVKAKKKGGARGRR
jgi:hypothetical protein